MRSTFSATSQCFEAIATGIDDKESVVNSRFEYAGLVHSARTTTLPTRSSEALRRICISLPLERRCNILDQQTIRFERRPVRLQLFGLAWIWLDPAEANRHPARVV